MGRRSINTTKSGKYMNPSDQARKEARKKELKKNKKQRQMVRAAVLKGKDPMQIIEEMEKIDQMEYNVLQPSPLNEKVLKDKRKKLRDTLDRVLKMYNKDDPEKWVELKRNQAEYERRRNQLVSFYESVKHAQQVSVDEIPLPAVQVPEFIATILSSAPAQIPLPVDTTATEPSTTPPLTTQPPSILKRNPASLSGDTEPPGVPPGPPPDFSSEDEEEDAEDSDANRAKTLRFCDDITVAQVVEEDDKMEEDPENQQAAKPTSLQQRMVALSGQNIDEFMKEMEAVHKNQDGSPVDDETNDKEEEKEIVPPGTDTQEPQPQVPAPIIPPNVIFRPPPSIPRPVLPLMAMRMPPGPPPPGPPPGLPPRIGLRLPPGPPPGIPPRLLRIPLIPPSSTASAVNPNVLSAAPQLINRNDGKQSATTIMAKPQIRNLSADVTRFVPSALRVKREDKKAKNITRTMLMNELKQQEAMSKPPSTATKDDAYMQFMREMEGLL